MTSETGPNTNVEKLLRKRWQQLLASFGVSANWTASLWQDLRKHYRQKKRAYHNFNHLYRMFSELERHQNQVEDLPVLQFSIWYHDYIYQPTSSNNELKSARFARQVLTRLEMGQSRIDRCYHQILLTKTHQVQPDDGMDEKLLIDFDLEVLGRPWPAYQRYAEQVRQEFWMYPDFLYRRGRRAALEKFLERDHIYQTERYREELEERARENLEREVEEL